MAERLSETIWLVERPELGTLQVTGPDALTWLNGLLSCEVVDLAPGQGRWGLLLTKTGKIVTDVNVIVGSGGVFMSTAPQRAEETLRMLEQFLIMEDAEVADRSGELVWAMLHGSRAGEAAASLGAALGAPHGSIDWTGLGGAALAFERARRPALKDAIQRTSGVREATPAEWQALRIESLLPDYGVDYDVHDNPHEASLERRAVSWTKGCYLGQEVVCMQDMRGKVKRRLVSLAIESAEPPAPGTAVRNASGEEVGRVTSSAARSTEHRAVAIARVQAEFSEPGKPLTVGESTAAAVVARPD